jgi:hypothetical protein
MQNQSKFGDHISLTEARHILGVSRIKIAQLVRDGYLEAFPSLLDKRVKLVSRAAVLQLQQRERAA